MNVYSYDPQTGVYTGMSEAQLCHKTKIDYIFPPNSTELQPPECDDGFEAYWIGNAWALREIAVPETIEPIVVNTATPVVTPMYVCSGENVCPNWEPDRLCPGGTKCPFTKPEGTSAGA